MTESRTYRLTVAVTLAPNGPTYRYVETTIASSLDDAKAQVRERHHRAYSFQFV
jgi:hypothetical protein